MQRSANEVMQAIIFSAVIDAIGALKASSKGMPNTLLREIQAVHPNITFADLPKELQDSIANNVRAAFSQLLKEGYAVGPRQTQSSQPLDRVPERQRRDPRPGGSDRRPRRPNGLPSGPDGKGPGRGPGAGPGRLRPQKGKPRLS